MRYLAHSKAYCGQEQSYENHISGCETWILYMLKQWEPFLQESFYIRIRDRVHRAIEMHDVGKLDGENQTDLKNETYRGRLKIPHQYAGALYLDHICHDIYGAALIYGHHLPGLPNLNDEIGSDTRFCGIFGENAENRRLLQGYTLDHKDAYLHAHCEAMKRENMSFEMIPPPESSLEERMMLSCLVNADWNDTGGKTPNNEVVISRRWKERLEHLDAYVADLSQKAELEMIERKRERNILRQDLYQECRNRWMPTKEACIYHGDACVGTGKTTAFLALALRFAIERQLRHIIIVLPYISILTQAENILKEAIILPDEEDKDEVVMAIHSRAEYKKLKLRQLEASWEAPVILTTAATFYESLAANTPSHLRKLQELPGSAIILDEFHDSAPAECIPVIWEWLGKLSHDWGCSVILSSGTMAHYWEHVRFKEVYGKQKSMFVPKPILSEKLQKKMESFEQQRVRMRITPKEMERCRFKKIDDLLDFALDQAGPRIIMVETREAAARIAYRLKKRGKRVYHLSNAFTAEDCAKILNYVSRALELAEKKPEEGDWTLVTTTYAAMGLNLSFRNGFCQVFSCAVYLQLLGRINRNEDYPEASLWAFELADSTVPENASMKISKEVFRGIIHGKVDGIPAWNLSPSELASFAFQEETKRMPRLEELQRHFLKLERNYGFADMAQKFKVISKENEVLAIVDFELSEALRYRKYCDSKKLQKRSVSISKNLAERLGLKQIVENTGLYALPYELYDSELLGCFKTLVDESV